MQELIQSLPNGLASGPDGRCLQHLIGAAAGNSGRDLLCALCEFYPPRTHSTLHPTTILWCRTNNCPSEKGGGIQPIAVGLSHFTV